MTANTLEAIKDRCEECGDCWIWQGACTQQGYPIFRPFAKSPCTLVRRAAFELAGGKLKERVPLVTKCGEKKCVNPSCIVESTTKKVARAAAKRGAFSTRQRAAKIAATKRTKGKLDMDKAREIMNSKESGPVLAARYGVDRSLITRIKRGDAWKDYRNPFAGLI